MCALNDTEQVIKVSNMNMTPGRRKGNKLVVYLYGYHFFEMSVIL